MPREDRRATSRFQPASGDRVFYGERFAPIRDLSLDGVFVCDPDPLPGGSEVMFTLRAGGQEISLQGIVRHSEDQLGMGIQFATLPAVSIRRLRIHIASLVTAASDVVKV
jgi:PilZ domain